MKFLSFILTLLVISSSTYAEWFLDTIASAGSTGYWTAIRLDSQNYLHIVYYDDTDGILMHAFQDGSQWNSEVIDSCNCLCVAMVLDSQDKPRISYWDGSDLEIRSVRWNGSFWETETVSPAQSGSGQYPMTDIEVDSLDRAHVVWFDGADTSLHYASEQTGGGWTTAVIDTVGVAGIFPSMCLDEEDVPFVSYGNASDGYLYCANHQGPEWEIELVDSVCMQADWTSIEFDQYQEPCIIYHRGVDVIDSPMNTIGFACHDGSGWEIETALTSDHIRPGSPQGLCFDGEGNPHYVYYYSDYGGFLVYGHRSSGGWSHEMVDGPGAGWDRAICIDSYGDPTISYNQMQYEDLRWAHQTSTGIWQSVESHAEIKLTPLWNPATGIVSMYLELETPGEVELSVYDVAGRRMNGKSAIEYTAGTHEIVIGEYDPGLYFCVARTGESSSTARFVVVR